MTLAVFAAIRPGTFDGVIDLKVLAATFVLAFVIAQVASMAFVYGWIPIDDKLKGPLSVFHRWEGRLVVFVALVIATLCILDPGPQSAPTRQLQHSIFGSLVIVLLVVKIGILRFVPKAGKLLPVLGVGVAASFGMIWYTSAYAFWFQGQNGYDGHAVVDATVHIVPNDGTVGAFNPPEIHVKKDHAIEWVNDQKGVSHTVTAGGFDSGPGGFGAGETFKWQFKKVGTVEYHCSIHPGMKAKVIVDE